MAKSNRNRAIIGIILVIIGAVFLLENFGYGIDLPWYIFRWPMILILVGIINLASGNLRGALILIGLGVVFYLDIFDILSIGQLWPLILIIIGLAFILGKGRMTIPQESAEDFIDEVTILSGSEKVLKSKDFQGGKITSLFGGSKIDLRGSEIKDTASIDIFCMFGGAEIQVPADWKVNTNATAILGGFSDERKNIEENTKGTLIIKGFVMFGGTALKS
ncbi:MAG: LiaI-LiaF-like domain-containing protein [Bacteroidota bacterium]